METLMIAAAGVSVAPFLPGSAVTSGVLSPANRTGPAWEGMGYGVCTSHHNDAYGACGTAYAVL
jgi:hypothetical protein